MLRLQHLSIVRGTRTLYDNVNLVASDGERIALVGENGSGKSSLFAAILGELSPESGTIDVPELVSEVAQSVEETDREALQYVLEGHAPLVAAQAEQFAAHESGDDMRIAAAAAHLAEINKGAVKAQALTIMNGLGFLPGDENRTVREFSGGWRNRLALARCLINPAQLLLLDEPTNHLDIDSLIWLEAWLKRLTCTVIIISHDREFLDRAVQTTWAVEDGTITRYGGNYSFYEMQRVQNLRLQEANRKAYERTAAHLKSYIERFRYKATKARQAQSRIKMLERLEVVEPVRSATSWRFAFEQPERMPTQLVTLEDVAAGYGENRVLSGVNLCIRSGERIGVLGVNGAGKSTLIKTLVGKLEPLHGTVRDGQGLQIGYFAQHQLEALDPDETPLDVMKRKAPLVREQQLRDHLGKFRFSGDKVDTLIGVLSGGEKARLALALIVWDKPNLIVLDEPTNHLDMATREALTVALSSFEGTLLLVSHDRHLLRSVCDKLILVHDGAVTEYDGDLDDYAAFVLLHRKLSQTADKPVTPQQASAGINRKEQRKLEALERNRIAALKKPLLAKLAKVEKEMGKVSEELASLDAQLADTAWYEKTPAETVADVTRRRGEAAGVLEELEAQWLEVSEQIEACV
jgi:ATP-binding cassette subfamily F protein 3